MLYPLIPERIPDTFFVVNLTTGKADSIILHPFKQSNVIIDCLPTVKGCIIKTTKGITQMKEKRIIQVRKRDGRIVSFDKQKITDAIFKAARALADRTGISRKILRRL